MMHLSPSPFTIKSNALLMSEKGTLWVINLSNPISARNQGKERLLECFNLTKYLIIRFYKSYGYTCIRYHSHLVHVHINNRWEVSPGLVISKESSLECSFVKHINGLGHENCILIGYSNKHSNTPPLHGSLK